ncbi:MAG: hypothetical protein LBM41_03750 [Ruminococcus sp.]|nr:hypothetical protein [Ruminococcus sp.]
MILLMLPVVLSVRLSEGKFKFEITYIFIKIFPKDKITKSVTSDDTETPSETEPIAGIPETETEKTVDTSTPAGKSKRSIAEMIELGKSVKEKLEIIYGSSSKGIRRICRKIIVDDIKVDIVVRGKEAAKTAVNYGIVSSIVYSLIAVVSSLATTYVENCDIDCDFDDITRESDVNISLAIKIRLHVLLSSGLLIGTKLLKRRHELFGDKKKGKKRKLMRTEAAAE